MKYAKAVLPIIRDLRPLLLSNWGAIAHTEKSVSPTDVVTALDIEIEQIVSKQLATLYPHISFVGEECGGNRDAESFWLMDPIDGTGHFVRGLPFATTMLALVEKNEAVFSVIYDFVNDHMYWAEKGGGAFMNETPIHVSNRSLAASYYSVEINLRKAENLATYQKMLGRGGRVSFLCAGWEFAMVACGKLDGRIGLDPFGKDYDFTPGCFLVAEAGGIVRNIGSDSYDYQNLNFIAANPILYKDLTEGPDAIFPQTLPASPA